MKRYSKKHTLKVYEVNCFGDLKLLSLFNILQEAACEHADILGIGYQSCVKAGVAWVAASYRVDITHLPKLGQDFIIETWVADLNAVTSQRCYRIKNDQGRILIEGITNWALISSETLRPVAISKNLPIDLNQIDGEKLKFSSDKIRLMPPEKTDFHSHFLSRFDEMDTNFHINNAIYPTWAAETLPPQWQETKVPTCIQINFKMPTKAFEQIDVISQICEFKTLHEISVADQTKALVQINWQNKN